MRTLLLMIFSACLLLTASACSSELEPGQEDFDIQGVIVQTDLHDEDHLRILVHYSDKQLRSGTGKVWFILSDGTELLAQERRSTERVDSEALKIGQDVRVWPSDVWLYSNPPQAGAHRIVIERSRID